MPHNEVVAAQGGEWPQDYTRRQIIAGGAASLAVFYGLAANASAKQPRPSHARLLEPHVPEVHSPPEPSMMVKALNIEQGTKDNDYNRQAFINGRSTGIGAFVLWAPPWDEWEPHRGHFEESVWESARPNMASASGLKTYVALPSQLPEWALPAPHHAPKYRGPKSSWARYFLRACQEFPDADGIIFANEPNLEFYKDRHAAKHAAEMMITANDLMRHIGYNKLLLGPASADAGHGYGVGWMRQFIHELRQIGQPFDVPAAIAYHGYTGVRHNCVRGVRQVAELTENYFPSDIRNVYLTELGYHFKTHETSTKYQYAYSGSIKHQEHLQKRNLISHFKKCQAIGNVALYANYTYQDNAWGGGGFMSGLVRYDGKPHKVLPYWSRLPSASGESY